MEKLKLTVCGFHDGTEVRSDSHELLSVTGFNSFEEVLIKVN
jgi:hypothetical protein